MYASNISDWWTLSPFSGRSDYVFLVGSYGRVYSYDDEENYSRDILPNEVLKVRISRDEEVIERIKERGRIFQQIKDCYENDDA